MTALEELYALAQSSATGVSTYDTWRPDPEDLGGPEKPVAGFVIHGERGSIGVLFFMPHPDGGSLTVHTQTFDASGEPVAPALTVVGPIVEVTLA
jgi:hypothetical protein